MDELFGNLRLGINPQAVKNSNLLTPLAHPQGWRVRNLFLTCFSGFGGLLAWGLSPRRDFTIYTALRGLCQGLCLSVAALLLAACATATPAQVSAITRPPDTVTAAPAPTQTPTPLPRVSPTATLRPSITPIPTVTSTITATTDTRLDPYYWSTWPIVPTVSGVAAQIYQRGIAGGNDPHVFSVVGDCQSAPNDFMGIYETNRYNLGNYPYLQETIDYFKGSFSRQSLAVHDGMSAPTALTPLWADKDACHSDESPVACELRVRKPSIMFVNLGTNWLPGASADIYGKYLRQVVDLIIANGTLPVLSTKADNVEGNQGINKVTAQIAHDYDIPLMNFWAAAQQLPNGGLDPNRNNVYLSTDGWDRHSFSALETLDALRRVLTTGK
jgi:hypothetical protein